jgi:uncharacterized protein YacL
MKEGFFSSKALLNIGLFFILIVGGVWWSQSSIKSSRPNDSINSGPGVMFPEEKASARAWQDPFDPYKNLVEEVLSQKESPNYRKLKKIFFQDRDKNEEQKSSLLLMGVMVPSRGFGDRVERRQRLRVAVVSALAAGGYAPENGEKLGFFPFTPKNCSQAIMVSYEFFSKLNNTGRRHSAFPSAFDRILVVWISEEHFIADPKPKPISNLSELRNELLQKNVTHPTVNLLSCFCSLFSIEKRDDSCNKVTVSSDSTNQWTDVPFYIFGPWSSTTLKTIYEEIKPSVKATYSRNENSDDNNYDNNPTVKILRNAKMTFFNVFATAPLDFIMNIDDDKNDNSKLLSLKNDLNYETFRQTVGRFSALFGTPYENSRLERNWLYPTCSDSLVAETVAQELKRRGINFDKDNIAMVAENDTLFGRSLPKIFRRIFERERKHDYEVDDEKRDDEKNINRFTYLRGLDGTVQSGSNTNKTQNALSEINNSSLPKQLSSSKNYSPKGNNQYDYLIRLRDTMRQDEYSSGKKFQAIGILGSDVYDKVILMQVLRPAFPNAIFFTTDLDADLWQPQHLAWTRNLIVGSSHGLQLHKDCQHGILPFRFSYQTALFQGILGATTWSEKFETSSCNPLFVSRKIDDPLLVPSLPRLFEIGLKGPVDLSPKILNQQNEKIHPDNILCSPSRTKIISTIAVLVIVILFLFVLNWLKKTIISLIRLVMKMYGKPTGSVFITLGIFVFIIFVSIFLHSLIRWYCQSAYFEYPEPYFWYSGVSGWALIILWSITILLSWILIVVAQNDHHQSLNSVQKYYFSEQQETKPEQSEKTFFSDFKDWLKQCWSEFLNEIQSNPESATPPSSSFNVETIWYEWRREKWFRAIIDIIALVIIFCATYWLLIDSGRINLHAPYRDGISYYLGRGTQFIAYFFFLALVFGTALLTRCCTNFIKKIDSNLGNEESGIKELKWSFCHTKFEKKWNVDIIEVADLVGVHFVARLTAKASNLVLYPIVPLILLCITYSSILENYCHNNYYYFILVVVTFMIFAPAYQLRRESTRIKQRLLERQRAKLNYHSHLNQDDDQRKRIENAIIDTENLKDGAFQSLLEHPLIQAILFLLGGISLPALLGLTGQTF